MLRILLFLIAFTSLVFSLVAVLDYWGYEEKAHDIATLMQETVTTTALEQRIEAAIQKDAPSEARMYLGVAERFNYPVNEAAYLSRIAALETPWHNTRRNVTAFAGGFMGGQGGGSTAGMAGAITADFTVVGDVRDLHEQYGKYAAGESVNELIVGLAGIGVGLTAATVASSGALAPAKTGTSALKAAMRAGKITPAFQRVLLRQSSAVFDYSAFLKAARADSSVAALRRAAVNAYQPRAFKALSQTTERVNNIRKSTSMADTVELLRYVENTDDLRRVERLSQTYGAQTRGILHLLGRSAIGTLRVLRHATEFIVAIASAAFSLLATLLSMSAWIRKKPAKA